MKIEYDNEYDNEYQTDEETCYGSGGAPYGVLFLFLWLFFVALPFFSTHYYTEFELAQPAKENSFASLSREFCSNYLFNDKVVIKTHHKLDEKFLFHYVYGVMTGKMTAYHAFAHLQNDGLSRSFKPTDIGQITELQNENYVPIQLPSFPVNIVQTNPVVMDNAGNFEL